MESPTGSPMIPPKLVPVLMALGCVAGAVVALAPPHTIAFKVATAVMSGLGLLGLASPGLRKAPDAENMAALNKAIDLGKK